MKRAEIAYRSGPDWSRSIEIAFEPRDLWIGAYWTRDEYGSLHWRTRRLRVFVCLLPMLPLIFTFQRDVESPAGARGQREDRA